MKRKNILLTIIGLLFILNINVMANVRDWVNLSKLTESGYKYVGINANLKSQGQYMTFLGEWNNELIYLNFSETDNRILEQIKNEMLSKIEKDEVVEGVVKYNNGYIIKSYFKIVIESILEQFLEYQT